MTHFNNERIITFNNLPGRDESLNIMTFNAVRYQLPHYNDSSFTFNDDRKVFSFDDYNNNIVDNRSQHYDQYPVQQIVSHREQTQLPSTVSCSTEGYKPRNYFNNCVDNNYNIKKYYKYNQASNNCFKRRNANKTKHFRNTNNNFRREKPYERPKFCNDEKARSIAQRLTVADEVNDAIKDLCSFMDVKNKQPLYAVAQALLIIEKEKQIENLKDCCDKGTQTANVQIFRSTLKREMFTPIPERRSDSSHQTPLFSTKMTVKLERITPISRQVGSP